jgi:hypothetical protein
LSGRISADVAVPLNGGMFIPAIDTTLPLGTQNVKLRGDSFGGLYTTVTAYGAKGDGATDDTAAFNAAVAALGTGGGTVYVKTPPSSYRLSGTITLPRNVSIIGDINKSAITTASGSYTLFSITGSFVTIANLSIENTAKSGGADISIDVGSGQIINTILSDIISYNGYGLVADSGSANGLYYMT